ncbi:MAG: NAD-dependent epimerase/dehydratase family protein [bacterium]|nr:NAD-dependent epimerase/dehydratase family protein [bacterium]
MRILITGGAGFVGSHIADACLVAGHQVLIVDDLSTGRRRNLPEGCEGIEFIEGDIRNAAWLAETVRRFRPEVVSHQAAQTSVAISAREPVLDADINVLGSLNLLDACVASEVAHVIFASTGGAIYGEVPDGERARLDWQPKPLSPYACSKFAVEGYLECYRAEHGLRSTVLRYANVYGPRQDPHGEAGVVAIFSQRAFDGLPLTVYARVDEGDPGCVRDYVYVNDVVRANLMAIDDRLGESMINVCTGVGISTLELAEAIKRHTRSGSEIGYGPRRVGDIERSVLDPGTPPPLGDTVPLETGLGETVAWFGKDAKS